MFLTVVGTPHRIDAIVIQSPPDKGDLGGFFQDRNSYLGNTLYK